jgi:hypothetical protein
MIERAECCNAQGVFGVVGGFGAWQSGGSGEPPAPENWMAFVRTHADGAASSVLVNLAVVDWLLNAPMGDEVIVAMDLQDVTMDGLPAQGELAALYQVEEALVAVTAQSGEARLMGHVFGQDEARFYIHADAGNSLRVTHVTIGAVTTEKMTDYILNPTSSEYQMAKDGMVLAQLAQNGDIAEAKREIEHWAYFPDQSAADHFVAQIAALGMQVRSVDTTPAAKGQVQVHFSHVGTVLPADISSITVPLDLIARRFRGQYDGWETPVVRQD